MAIHQLLITASQYAPAVFPVPPPEAASRLARRAAEERVGEQLVSGEHSRVVGAPREQVGQLLSVVVALRVVEHLAVQLHALSHFDLGELGPQIGTS